jgi:hypothetical protein
MEHSDICSQIWQSDFQNLVNQISMAIEFVKRYLEQLSIEDQRPCQLAR